MNKHKNAGFIRVSLLTKADIDNKMVNKINEANVLVGVNRFNNRRTSTYMRQTLFKRIKDEGIYSESEEESESESIDDSQNFDIPENTSRKNDADIIDFDHSSKNSKNSEKNKNSNLYSEKRNEKKLLSVSFLLLWFFSNSDWTDSVSSFNQPFILS